MGQTCCSGRKKRERRRSSIRGVLLKRNTTNESSSGRSASPPRRSVMSMKTRADSAHSNDATSPGLSPIHPKPVAPPTATSVQSFQQRLPQFSQTSEDESVLWTHEITLLQPPQKQAHFVLTSLSVYLLQLSPQLRVLNNCHISHILAVSCSPNREKVILHVEEAGANGEDFAIGIKAGEELLRQLMQASVALSGSCIPLQTISSDYVLTRLRNNLPRKRVLDLREPDRLKTLSALFTQHSLLLDILAVAHCSQIDLARSIACVFVLTPTVIVTLKPAVLSLVVKVEVAKVNRVAIAMEEKAVGIETDGKFLFYTLPLTTAEVIVRLVAHASGRKLEVERVKNLSHLHTSPLS